MRGPRRNASSGRRRTRPVPAARVRVAGVLYPQGPPAAAGPAGEEPPQVVALVAPGFLALDASRVDSPGVQDPPAELALLGGDDHRRGRYSHQAAQFVQRSVGRVVRQPVARVGGDPLSADVVEGLAQHRHQRFP